MRNWFAGFCLLCCAGAHAAELMLLSAVPVELFERSTPGYAPVAMVQQVLKYYPAPYKIESVSLNRAFAELNSRPGACVVGVRKTPQRQRDYLFSLPYIIAPDIRLMVKTGSPWVGRLKALQDKDGRVSLQQLLALAEPPVLVTEDGRSYGAAMDPALAGYRQQHPAYVKTAKVSRFGDTIPMLQKGYADLVLEYPAALNTTELAVLQSFRLKEADPYALAYFACKRDAETAALLQQLDSAIAQFRQQPEFKTLLLDIYAPAEREHVWQVWQQLSSQD
ncbi:transporter substrate-binding domain-containing protein [Rheinheimera texasensis]|uniref:transporter substrate-binding domain-containing protein n=1 Tax=Rheinheimera texasensis TaxID=306205 RepID=UPI0032B20D49